MKKILSQLLVALMIFSASAFSSDKRSERIDSERPNIVFIAVDDLKPMLGAYGNQEIKSPAIDRLAERGVTFTNSYCQQAVCAPSRISAFTGFRPDRTGVWDLKTNMRDINPDIVTIPQFLAKNDYITVGLGKLMHGAKDNDPESWTIAYRDDSSLKYADGFKYPANGKYQSEEIHEAYKRAKKDKLNWQETNLFLKGMGLAPSTECLDIPDNAYEDGAIATEATRLLQELKNKRRPFFLALGFHKPHLPFSVPKKYWDLYNRDEIGLSYYTGKAEGAPLFAYHTWGELRNYSDIPDKGPLTEEKQKEIIHGYMASVSYVDAQIGKVLSELDRLHLNENTIVILWGDHGWHLGDHGLWCKHSNFEQAVKSPLVISSPLTARGASARTMAELVDLFPTICDLTGLDIPDELDGTSLVPAMIDPSLELKSYALSQYPRGDKRMGYSIRTARYRLTVWFTGNFREDNIIREKNIEAIELYDYLEDPYETRSISEDTEYLSVKEELLELLLASTSQASEQVR